MQIGPFIAQYFPIVLAIVGTIALALGSLTKFRETRIANMLEATTTWKSLAESRQALLDEERETVARLTRSVADLKAQNDYLWGQLNKGQPPQHGVAP